MSGWDDNWEKSEPRPVFPKVGDKDTFKRANAPEDDKGYAGKMVVRTMQRRISVFKSQLAPVGKYFKDHPHANVCNVNWIGEEHTSPDNKKSTWVVAVIQQQLDK